MITVLSQKRRRHAGQQQKQRALRFPTSALLPLFLWFVLLTLLQTVPTTKSQGVVPQDEIPTDLFQASNNTDENTNTNTNTCLLYTSDAADE